MPITVRHSELRDYRQCALKHHIRWTQGWRAQQDSEKSRLGTAWHMVLETHHGEVWSQQQGLGYRMWRLGHADPSVTCKPLDAAVDTLFDDLADGFEVGGGPLSAEQVETLRWMYEGYRAQFGFDPDWEIVAIENTLTAQLGDLPGAKISKPVLLNTHEDLVVRDWSMGGRYVVIDHKSTARPLYQREIDLDDQFGLYQWARVSTGWDVLAVICNQAKTDKLKRPMTLEERFNRVYSTRTKAELNAIRQDALDTVTAMQSGLLYSNPNPRDCGWSCEFMDAHISIRKDRRGLDALPSILTARGFTQDRTDG